LSASFPDSAGKKEHAMGLSIGANKEDCSLKCTFAA
jgi:hypothetical protein